MFPGVCSSRQFACRRECYVRGQSVALDPSPRIRLEPSAQERTRDRLFQLLDLGLQKAVREDERANSRAQVAVAGGNRLIDRGLQLTVASLFNRFDG